MNSKQQSKPIIIRGSLQQTFNGGWEWAVKFPPEYDTFARKDVSVTRYYHTNGALEGLWNGDSQIEGTVQFSLSSDYDKARRQIKCYFGA